MKHTIKKKKESQSRHKVTEHQIQSVILEYLGLVGVFAWRNNSGAVFSEYKGRKRMIRFGLKGSADILGVLKDGRFLAIEVKDEKGKLSEEQEIFLSNVNLKGGLAFMARSLEDVEKRLGLKSLT